MTRLLLTFVMLLHLSAVAAAEVVPSPEVLAAEAARVETIARISTVAVAIFDNGGQGGGSGVLISPEGFALTNFHVVAPCGAAMKCGLNNGELYDAVVVGVDPVGDVALVQLLGRDDFPAATLGNSDQVQVGDWAYTVGNPFLLADDFRPSVSLGMISGMHRYQYPAGTLLEYADCLQTDAAINPGNSGGGLFDSDGNLIGINGRGSFEKRGRVNVGVGYAISVNQIKRFLSHLKSGRIVDHASLGFTVATSEIGRVVVDDILETSDAYRRGLRYGDEIVEFAGREITSANGLQTALGTYPRDWTVPLTYRREGETFTTQVRLPGVHDPAQLVEMIQQQEHPLEPPEGELPKPKQPPSPGEQPPERPKPHMPRKAKEQPLPAAVTARYEESRGYANYWYNRQRQRQLWDGYTKQSQIGQLSAGDWVIAGNLPTGESFQIQVGGTRGSIRLPAGQSGALFAGELDSQLSPPGSGGLLVALHLWQRFLAKGLQQFGEVYYLGQLPIGPDGAMADCLVGLYGGVEFRLLFSPEDGELVGLDLFAGDDLDPCEVRFLEYSTINGVRVPVRWQIRCGDQVFAELVVDSWQVVPSSAATEGVH